MERRGQPVGAAMLIKREHLMPLVAERFDLASLHFPTVNGSGCAKALTNLYLAPLPLGTEVVVKVYVQIIALLKQNYSSLMI